ncbi:hypothetical protein EW145_g6361 [Phellinidium pouzarii]|uniref:non-specific serine/threonine protein kinase n=1 Tax=Phellinidium pouzarii TaxID=167371 RepID=A0A4S4L1J1_9AGAM|nr:hypothetical protein EW145_g6361 [Phellinidium pouzarii]
MNNTSHALGDYRVNKRIAQGGFGVVYNGEAPDGKPVPIKYERTYSRITRPYLQHEAHVYRLLEGNPCVPTVYAYDREARWNIMVLDLLGPSLKNLFKKCGSKFSLKTTLMVAIQMIECLEYVHSKGIIHRDIKPDNFLMGLGSNAFSVHIIDFGLARRFRHPQTLEHFPYFEDYSFLGTLHYASYNALLGRSQSRRDDLESLAYTIICFLRGRLPWQNIRGRTEKHREQRIKEKKRTWTSSRLCDGMPEEFAIFLEYTKNLEYEQEPDYGYLKDLFRKLFERHNFVYDFDYGWLLIAETRQPEIVDETVLVSEEVEGEMDVNSAMVDDSASVTDNVEPSINSDKKYSVQKESGASGYITGGKGAEQTSGKFSVPLFVQKSDYVLIKVLARPTLEHDVWEWLKSKEPCEESDNSYWHDPSISREEWKFPWRPALVLDVNARNANTRLFLLPLVHLPDGLESRVSAPRRPAFFYIKPDVTYPSTSNGLDTSDQLMVIPTPAWPLDNTYHYHQRNVFQIFVPTKETCQIEVEWHLDGEQLSRLTATRNDMMSTSLDRGIRPCDDENFQISKRQNLKSRVVDGMPVFGSIRSLTSDAYVELEGTNGWLPEFYKIERRCNEENGIYSDDDDDDDDVYDEENLSLYTGNIPGNRRLSCTLATEPDAIVETSISWIS